MEAESRHVELSAQLSFSAETGSGEKVFHDGQHSRDAHGSVERAQCQIVSSEGKLLQEWLFYKASCEFDVRFLACEENDLWR